MSIYSICMCVSYDKYQFLWSCKFVRGKTAVVSLNVKVMSFRAQMTIGQNNVMRVIQYYFLGNTIPVKRSIFGGIILIFVRSNENICFVYF